MTYYLTNNGTIIYGYLLADTDSLCNCYYPLNGYEIVYF